MVEVVTATREFYFEKQIRDGVIEIDYLQFDSRVKDNEKASRRPGNFPLAYFGDNFNKTIGVKGVNREAMQ